MITDSLSKIIDSGFLKFFANAGSTQSESQKLSAALKGQSSQSSVSTSLRTGAQTYATAISALNNAISLVNVSQTTLSGLSRITGEMENLCERARGMDSSDPTRRKLNAEFRQLAADFDKTVEEARVGETEYLTVDGLEEVFTLAGLDPEKCDEIAGLFKKFAASGSGRALAGTGSELGGGGADLSSNSRLTDLENALREVRGRIDQNKKVLDRASSMIEDNLTLVRVTGTAMLELSDQIKSGDEAEEVARQLKMKILKHAGAALAQADNLEPIAVAALVLEQAAEEK